MRRKLPALYSQEHEKDPLVICKFFDPVGSWTWYVLEGSPVDTQGEVCAEHDAVDFLFFGLVVGFEAELGYFSLRELETAKDGVRELRAVPIERDLSFTPCRLSEIRKLHGAFSREGRKKEL